MLASRLSRHMIRVLVVDDHAMFREMLRLALPFAGGIEVAGEGSDGQEAIALAARLHPDIVLLDYKMPRVNDFGELVRGVRAESPGAEVIVLTAFSSNEVAAQAGSGG